MAQRPLASAAVDLHFDMANDRSSQTAHGGYHHANGYAAANDHTTPESDPDITWSLERPAESAEWIPAVDQQTREASIESTSVHIVLYEELLPGHKRSLSGISIRAFLLGITLGACVPLAFIYGRQLQPPEPAGAWRIFFLLATLSIFHFLEFWTHARYNVPKAGVSAFILFNNGWQYTAANFLTLVETTITSLFFPTWQARFSSSQLQAVALVVIVFGQLIRSLAMAQAGTNFNHKVQTKRSKDHQLVTTGIYGWLRHPSYFGFFWWAVALQVFLGNAICFWIYVVVLWSFFNKRIARKRASSLSQSATTYVRRQRITFFTIQ